jgi:hypothetical protein
MLYIEHHITVKHDVYEFLFDNVNDLLFKTGYFAGQIGFILIRP